jgi:hypothetical protein
MSAETNFYKDPDRNGVGVAATSLVEASLEVFAEGCLFHRNSNTSITGQSIEDFTPPASRNDR